MYIRRKVKVQLGVFAAISVVAVSIMVFGYAKLPALWFDVGRYTVTMQLPEAAGLYERANVTYRGVEVGEVQAVTLTDAGVEAVLSMKSDSDIPSDLDAEVHSASAVGEQYVALMPRAAPSPRLRDGDTIAQSRTSVPPAVDGLLDDANTGLQAIPQENLRTVVDESYSAVGGLGPELGRLVRASTTLASDSRAHLNSVTTLIDQSGPVLASQAETSDAIRQWAAQVSNITHQLQTADTAVAGVLRDGGPAANEARLLIERLQPTLPILLANMVSVGQVNLDYRANLEQLLVLAPAGIASASAGMVANQNNPGPADGAQLLSVHLNVNLPRPCLTGFLPPSQQRPPALVDTPARPEGDLYCRVPQDSRWNVRGARNIPCATRPGKRAPTAAMCESDEEYVPLNDGNNWKGDPNATASGQDVPQLRTGSASTATDQFTATPPPITMAEYDPATGSYLAPDGTVHTRTDISSSGPPGTWQSMLLPPA